MKVRLMTAAGSAICLAVSAAVVLAAIWSEPYLSSAILAFASTVAAIVAMVGFVMLALLSRRVRTLVRATLSRLSINSMSTQADTAREFTKLRAVIEELRTELQSESAKGQKSRSDGLEALIALTDTLSIFLFSQNDAPGAVGADDHPMVEGGSPT